MKRREFLVRSGQVLLATSAARLFSRNLFAQSVNLTVPNFVFIRVSHGGVPAGALEGSFNFSQELQVSPTYKIKYDSLSDRISQAGKISDILGTNFNALSSKINLLTHLSSGAPYFSNHFFGGALGCGRASWQTSDVQFTARPTLDQILNIQNPSPYGSPLVLADQQANGIKGPSYLLDPNHPEGYREITGLWKFLQVYNALFGQFIAPNANEAQARSLSLSKVISELESYSQKRSIPSEHRERYEIYQDLLQNIQNAQGLAASCDVDNSNYPDSLVCTGNYTNLVDLLSLGLSCGQVRYITYAAARPNCVSYGGGGGAQDYGLHTWVHSNSSETNRQNIVSTWRGFFNNFVLPLAQRLDSIPTTNGSLLDNTIITILPENSYPHKTVGMTMVTLGGSNFINTGKIISYANYEPGQDTALFSATADWYAPYNRAGAHLNNWFETALQISDVPRAAYNQYCAPGYGFGDFWKAPGNAGGIAVNGWNVFRQYFDHIYQDASFTRSHPLPLLL